MVTTMFNKSFWWSPSSEELEWAMSIIESDNIDPPITHRINGDEREDCVRFQEWEICVCDDGIFVTGPSENYPDVIRAIAIILGAYRASWWPGGTNYKPGLINKMHSVLAQAPFVLPEQRRLIEWHAKGTP